MALCPHCEKAFNQVAMEPVKGQAPNGTRWNCVAYTCPNCHKAIGVDIDSSATRADVIEAIEDLKRRLGV